METITTSKLKEMLCARISDSEWEALERGGNTAQESGNCKTPGPGGDLCISSFNRSVMLRLRDSMKDDALDVVDCADVRKLADDLSAYLAEYMADRPEGHKWIIIACLYLTFVEKLPMHPQEAAKWQKVGDRYVCPNNVPDSITCGYCVCEAK